MYNISMVLFLFIFLSLSIVALLAVSRTRRYQLGQLAKQLNMTYENYRESITTVQTAGRLEFFTLFFHQYNNVFTASNTSAFIRMADDTIFVDDKPGTRPNHITVFTAELKTGQFPTFKIVPAVSLFGSSQYPLIKTGIPAVDTAYRIYSPADPKTFSLTPAILSLLKSRPNIYLEVNDNALIFHEHTLVAPGQFQLLRMHGMQFLQECESMSHKQQENTITKTASASNSTPAADSAKQAEAMLAALTLSNKDQAPGTKKFAGVSIIIIVMLLLGILLAARVILQNIPH